MRLAALFLACSLHAADWISLRAPGVELFSDASEKTARQALDRLQQIEALLGNSQAHPIPLRVVLFAKESEYRQFAVNSTAEGFYQSGFDRDYIITSAGGALARVVAHEYVHFVSNERTATHPTWLEEGLADFYSTYDGKRIGIPIPEHLKLLEQRPWLTAEQMNNPTALDETFYAQSWALVHMLRRKPRFPERITTQMLTELRQYIRDVRPTPVGKAPPIPSVASAEPVSPLNALLLKADIAIHSGRTPLARALYTQATQQFPNSSSAVTGLATLAYADGDRDAALKELRRALQMNDRDAQAWFELAVIENDDEALAKAAELNPNLADAHLLIGVRATDDGDLDTALQHLEQATSLMPRKSYAWYSLGYAQSKRGDGSAARRSLERALQTATSQEQRSMAATLLDSLP